MEKYNKCKKFAKFIEKKIKWWKYFRSFFEKKKKKLAEENVKDLNFDVVLTQGLKPIKYSRPSSEKQSFDFKGIANFLKSLRLSFK